MAIVLASTSPYRRELMHRLRLPFEVVAPAVDEARRPGEAPRALALRLAEAKAIEVAQLERMQGRRLVFHTALAVAAHGRVALDSIPTTVDFRRLARDALDAYLRADQPYDCAGAAKIESLGIALVERVESDDPTALIGLPLIRLTSMLEAAGVVVLGG